jgi:hypothetical protein
MSQCTFAGPGVSGGIGPNNKSVGLGLSIGTSITGQSKTWNNFETAGGVDFSDFNGAATWVEPGGVAAGTDISAKAVLTFPAPDGYQFVIGVTGTHAQNQSLYKRPLYTPSH